MLVSRCSGVNVTSNILGGAMQGGIYFHQGGNNVAQNNIIVDGSQYQARETRFLAASRASDSLPVLVAI
jgi:parallel beta-helix repeat protein